MLPRCCRWARHLRLRNLQNQVSAFSSSVVSDKPSRPAPPPIRVALTESAGRGVFATRRIGAGELIHTAKPVVAHPIFAAIDRVCYFCLRKIKASSDSQRQSVLFCSGNCEEQSQVFYDVERKADWLDFNDYCRAQGLKYPLLVKRLACMVISGAVSADALDILQPACLSPDMISKMEEGFALLRNTFMKAEIKEEMMTCILHRAD